MTRKRKRKREAEKRSGRRGGKDDWKVRGMDDKLMSASVSISTHTHTYTLTVTVKLMSVSLSVRVTHTLLCSPNLTHTRTHSYWKCTAV